MLGGASLRVRWRCAAWGPVAVQHRAPRPRRPSCGPRPRVLRPGSGVGSAPAGGARGGGPGGRPSPLASRCSPRADFPVFPACEILANHVICPIKSQSEIKGAPAPRAPGSLAPPCASRPLPASRPGLPPALPGYWIHTTRAAPESGPGKPPRGASRPSALESVPGPAVRPVTPALRPAGPPRRAGGGASEALPFPGAVPGPRTRPACSEGATAFGAFCEQDLRRSPRAAPTGYLALSGPSADRLKENSPVCFL